MIVRREALVVIHFVMFPIYKSSPSSTRIKDCSDVGTTLVSVIREALAVIMFHAVPKVYSFIVKNMNRKDYTVIFL